MRMSRPQAGNTKSTILSLQNNGKCKASSSPRIILRQLNTENKTAPTGETQDKEVITKPSVNRATYATTNECLSIGPLRLVPSSEHKHHLHQRQILTKILDLHLILNVNLFKLKTPS